MSGAGAGEPAAAVWGSLPLPGLIVDAADRILALNPEAEAFLRASDRALRGQDLAARLDLGAALPETLARVRGGTSAIFLNDVAVGTAGGRAPLPCNVRLAPLAGWPGHVLIVLDPRETSDRLARLPQARSAGRSAIGMAEMLAHEIKNPLAGITGAAQLLAMGLNGEDLELTGLIVAECRRVAALLTQVELFGTLAPPRRRALNIHDALERARRSAALGFAAHMTLREDYDPSLPETWGDPDQLVQVFLNLLKNAAEAGRPGGTITLRSYYDRALRLRKPDGSAGAVPLQVEVIDDGPGLPPDIAADIFEPFVSGRETGTGLGLALVARIVAEHDGWIAVDSAPGRTLFRVSLPVAPVGHGEG
jgi:two-component system nitrogen regulation sensor histidine kinase GlnL